MPGDDQEFDVVGEVVEMYLEHLRRGQRPDLGVYLERYPHLAERIRDAVAAVELIEDHAQSESEASAQRSIRSAPAAESLPEAIGDYEVLREIGRGGMGVVYEAEHRTLRRRVALKVLTGPLAQNPTALERFRREAQSAARLHHTNIVPVFEVGSHEGAWFYAMQYIPGQPLDAVLEDLRRLRTPDSQARGAALFAANNTNPKGTQSTVLPGGVSLADSDTHHLHYYRSVAQVGIQVARALAYAHRQGIVHRDIKPSNLLLDAAANVWITDFGLAKGEGENLTHAGDVVGTLRYMAPERFGGDSRAPSDLYSLGITLYEMLALKPAFDGVDRVQLIRDITHHEPAALRRLDLHIPKDLATIVHKAMDKEAARRYASADELADDLQRFLQDEPIRARPAGPLERLHRWSRRNPAIALLLLGLLVTLLAGVTVSTWQAVKATQARDAEAQARRRTREAFNTLTDEVLQQLLGKQIQLGEEEKQFLRKVQKFYEEAAAEQGESEEARADRADGLYRLARIRAWLGELEEAESSGREAIAQFRQLAADFPGTPAYRLQLAVCLNQQGKRLLRREQSAEAKKLHEDALAACQALAGNAPDDAGFRQELARCHGLLAHLELDNRSAAIPHIDKALAIQQALAEQFPAIIVYRHEWVQSLITRARLHRKVEDNSAAIATYRQALKIQVQVTAQAKGVVEYQRQEAELHRFLGTLLDHHKEPREAEQAFRAALTIQARLAADYPTVPLYQEELAFSYHNLGRRIFSSDPKQAERYYRDSLLLRRKLKDNFPTIPNHRQDLIVTCRQLCDLLANGQQWREAEPIIREAVAEGQDLSSRSPNADPGSLQSDRMRLVDVLIHTKAHAEARKLLDEQRNRFHPRYQASPNKAGHAEEMLHFTRAYEQLGDDALAMAFAEDLAGLNHTDVHYAPGGLGYQAACLAGRCVLRTQNNKQLSPDQRDKRVQLHADKAIKLLHLSVSQGFRDLEALRSNGDLTPVRKRGDFQKLLQDLQARPNR